MERFHVFAVLALVIFVSGCASLSKEECVGADWRLIGYEDGVNGSSPATIGRHRKACAEHGVVPNKAAYDAGYHEGILAYCSYNRGLRAGQYGLRAENVCPSDSAYVNGYDKGLIGFCTYDMGYSEALEGEPYLRVCPHALEGDFLAGYELGSRIYELRTELEWSEARIAEIMDQQEHLTKDIADIQRQIVFDKELTVPERLALVSEMNDLAEDIKELEAEHEDLDGRIEEIRRELDRMGVGEYSV